MDNRQLFINFFTRALKKQAHDISSSNYNNTANKYFDAVISAGSHPAIALMALVCWVENRADMPTPEELIHISSHHPSHRAN